jgi:Zn-dependent protease
MAGTVRIGRILGIPVGIHWSLLGIAALLTFNLAHGNLPMAHPGRDGWVYWAIAAATTVAFLATVLAHEVGHAVAAHRYGVGVEGIDLWILGGVARLSEEAPTPKAEWRIAAAGPLISVLMTFLFAGAAMGIDVFAEPGLISTACWWLAIVNGLLAIFNLLPASPLDGGRILAAMVWRRTGDRILAAERASQAGQFLGWLLIAWGMVGLLYGNGGTFITVFLGWFLLAAARQDVMAARARAALAGVTVADVAWFGLARAGADTDTLTMLWDRGRMGDIGIVAVEGPDGSVLGLVSERQLWKVREGAMATTSLGSLASRIDRYARARADEPLVRALTRLHPMHPTLTVWDGDRLVGVVTHQAVERRLDQRQPRLEPVA